ncbi:MAG TPA: TonB-dependent receptor [Coleofasciculaceae cyanobacterium]|jgi:vitamin B12 transporter
MKLYLLVSGISLLSWSIVPVAIAQTTSPTQTNINPTDTGVNNQSLPSVLIFSTEALPQQQPITDIPRLSEIEQFHTSAALLVQQPTRFQPSPTQTNPTQLTLSQTNQADDQAQPSSPTNKTDPNATQEQEEIEITVTGERESIPETSAPVYVITEEEIQQQGSNTVAEVLRGLPGFSINNVGFGADIHTGTYYRGASINQSVFLLNGRSIGTNINTYHGATDLNSLPVGSIERVELSSGTSSTLYGSGAFGGIVNIITKQGEQVPRLNGLVQYGSYDQSNYQASYGGSAGSLRYNFSYEKYEAENRYRVPVGAANRDAQGRLFNGDTATDNYYASLSLDLNPRNTISLDGYKISSRRGLLYFGFPLQTDRLDHDVFNVGLSWKTLLGGGEESVLRTTLAYNQDFFNTYGPTQNIYYRTGTLDSQVITGRVEHQWQMTSNNKLTWGVDLQNNVLDGDVLSTAPTQIALNETENRDRFHTALFALNTWKLSDAFQTDLGLRQNFSSEFGSYLNPSVGARWAVTRSVAVRGSWALVQNNPGLDQLYVYDTVHNWLPNPNLKPETGSSWTAGLDVGLSPSLTGQFTYFGNRLADRLGILTGRWANIGLVNTNGIEVALRWKMTSKWSTFLNYTYTDAKIKTGSEQGLQLGLVPYSVAQAGVGYSSGGWQLNLIASYNSGSRRAFFNSSGQSTTDFSPSWLNLDLSARIPVSRNLGLVVYLENLADKIYEKANRIYQPGLTFRIGLQSNF